MVSQQVLEHALESYLLQPLQLYLAASCLLPRGKTRLRCQRSGQGILQLWLEHPSKYSIPRVRQHIQFMSTTDSTSSKISFHYLDNQKQEQSVTHNPDKNWGKNTAKTQE